MPCIPFRMLMRKVGNWIMGCDVLTTLGKIEKLRRLMYDVARDKNLSDPELVNLSQRLDRLLNDYQTLEANLCWKCNKTTAIRLPRGNQVDN